MHKNHKSYFWFLCVLCLFVAVPLPVIGQADIHRIRSNASIIPLERPKELEGNWWDRDAKRALNLRTSIIVDPSDGKVPPLTPQAQKRLEAERLRAREHPC